MHVGVARAISHLAIVMSVDALLSQVVCFQQQEQVSALAMFPRAPAPHPAFSPTGTTFGSPGGEKEKCGTEASSQ